jgi:uncharacterized protein RhaS with RHS repeats
MHDSRPDPLTQTITDRKGQVTTHTYDSVNRRTVESASGGNSGTVTFTYDMAGRRTSMTVGGQATVSYTHDHNARLRTIAQAPMSPAMIDYDATNRRTRLTLSNGVWTTRNGGPVAAIFTFRVDGKNRVDRIDTDQRPVTPSNRTADSAGRDWACHLEVTTLPKRP